MRKQVLTASVCALVAGIFFTLCGLDGPGNSLPIFGPALFLAGLVGCYLQQFQPNEPSTKVKVKASELAALVVGAGVVGFAILFGLASMSNPLPGSPSARQAASASGPILHSFRVLVTGADFKGSLLVVQPDGQIKQESVDGRAGWEKTVAGGSVSLTFQKDHDYGTIEVQIFKDGQAANSGKSEADYGVVSLTAR